MSIPLRRFGGATGKTENRARFAPKQNRHFQVRKYPHGGSVNTPYSGEAEYAERHAEAAQLARQEWNSARMCDANHPYLRRKGIPALEGIRQSRDGSLLIPVMDAANNLQSLQRVYPDGTKRFLVGGKVSGGQFIIQGQPEKPVAVCEGFATGTSIHLATGWVVYVAFSVNNLATVAKTTKERFPDKTIIICGDNDEAGSKKSEEAAQAENAQLVFPNFTNDNGTDFNALHQIEGIEAVRKRLVNRVLEASLLS